MNFKKIICTILPVFLCCALNAQVAQKKVLACKLTSPELQKRKEEVISVLKEKVIEKVELENGYKYRFANTKLMKLQINSFIKSEKSCCDFFEFEFTEFGSNLWLKMTGPEGVKDFMKEELDF